MQKELNSSLAQNSLDLNSLNFKLSDINSFYFIYNTFKNLNPYLDELQILYEKFFSMSQNSLKNQLIILVVIQFIVVIVIIISQYIFILIGYEKAKKKMKNLKIKIQSNNVQLTQKKIDEFLEFCNTFNVYSLYVIADFEISMKKTNKNENLKNFTNGNPVNINSRLLTKELSNKKSFYNLNFLNTKNQMSSIKEIFNFENSSHQNHSFNNNELKKSNLTPNFQLSVLDNSLIYENLNCSNLNIGNSILNINNNLIKTNSIRTAKFNTSNKNLCNIVNNNNCNSKNLGKNDRSDSFNYSFMRNNTNSFSKMNSLGPNKNFTKNEFNDNSIILGPNNCYFQSGHIPSMNKNTRLNEDPESNNLLEKQHTNEINFDSSIFNTSNIAFDKIPHLKKLFSFERGNYHLDIPLNEGGTNKPEKLSFMLGNGINLNKIKRSPSIRSDNLNKSNLTNKNDHSEINLLSQDYIENNQFNKYIFNKLKTCEINLSNKNNFKRVFTSKNFIVNNRNGIFKSEKIIETGNNMDFEMRDINKKLDNLEEDLPSNLSKNKNYPTKFDDNSNVQKLENLKNATDKQIGIPFGNSLISISYNNNLNHVNESNKTATFSSKDKYLVKNLTGKNNIKKNLKKEEDEESHNKDFELKDLKDMKMSEMNILNDATLVKKKNELKKKDKPKEEDVEISVEQIIFKNFLPKIFLIIFGLFFSTLYSLNIFFNISYVNKITSINQYSKIIQERIGLIDTLLLNYEVAILLNTTKTDYNSLFKKVDKNRLEIIEMNKADGLKFLYLSYELEKNLADKKFCEYISVKIANSFKTKEEKELIECKLIGNQMNSNGFYNAYSTVYNTLKVLYDDMTKLEDLSEESLLQKIIDFTFLNVKMNVDFTFRKLDILEKTLINEDLENIFSDFLNIENIFSILSLIFCVIFCFSSILIVILPIKSVEIIISWLIHKLLKDL